MKTKDLATQYFGGSQDDILLDNDGELVGDVMVHGR